MSEESLSYILQSDKLKADESEVLNAVKEWCTVNAVSNLVFLNASLALAAGLSNVWDSFSKQFSVWSITSRCKIIVVPTCCTCNNLISRRLAMWSDWAMLTSTLTDPKPRLFLPNAAAFFFLYVWHLLTWKNIDGYFCLRVLVWIYGAGAA